VLDLLLHNGIVVDGTGAPAVRADVGIEDGRIVAVGAEAAGRSARRTLDVEGRVVAPGFVDVHTHYDAQVLWDPALTPSSLHGVTTVLGGNCGYTMAPMTPEAAAYVLPSFARVEGIAVETLEAGLDLEWSTFASWLDRLEGGLALNAGFSVGHSTLRCLAMGPDAVGGTPDEAQLEAMAAMLEESIVAGALGFSSSWGASHFDHHGDPVPSRHADRAELVALAGVLARHPGTSLEFLPCSRPSLGPDQYEVMTAMALAAGRTLNWNLLVVRPGADERAAREAQLAASDHAAERGARVVCLALPEAMHMRLSFLAGVLYDITTGWAPVMHLPVAERIEALRRPEVRARLREGALADGYREWTDWAACHIADVGDPALADLVGRTVGEIAAARGADPFDALLDVVVADRLRTGIEVPTRGDDDESWAERVAVLQDHRIVPGGSDAGAHQDMIKTWGCYTGFLHEAVQRRGLLPLERAVQLITQRPAQLYGLVDRGTLAVGSAADVVVFDPEAIRPGPCSVRADLPGGGWRLYSEAEGIDHTFVNGVEVAAAGTLTDARPGTVLRSGRDTA
jgi:N-acyl-D-aspartate/D-glutamate deacylase